MARQGITFSEVAEAATQLTTQGRHPTIEQVRIILGTGSSTTIANHLKTWKEQQSASSLTASREQIPEELIAIIKGLWERVHALSDEKLTAITADYQTSLNQKQEELEKYQQNNRRWQQLYHQLKQEKDGLTQARRAADTLIENMREEYALLDTKYKLATQQLIEKQEHQQDLHHHLLQTQKNLEQFQESTRQQRQQEQHEVSTLKKTLHKENSELRANLEALQHDFNTLRLQHHKVVHERDKMINDIAAFEKCQIDLKTAEQARSELAYRAQHLQTQYQETIHKLNDRNTLLTESQSQIKFMQQQLAAAQQELVKLRDQNKQLEKENWSLLQNESLVPA